jgi:hypothetical protein
MSGIALQAVVVQSSKALAVADVSQEVSGRAAARIQRKVGDCIRSMPMSGIAMQVVGVVQSSKI